MKPLALLLPTLLPLAAQAGNLDNAAPPANGSGMPSLSGLYQQLSTGTPATVPGAFQEPTVGPNGGTGRSLTDLLTLLPVADNVNGAQSAQVLAGKTFWGLSNGPTGQWGLRTGTMPLGSNVMGSNGALAITLPAGYYDGSKTATAADTNLVAGNIKSGVTIFGVSGTAAQATGSATAAQVLNGATFSNSTANGLTGTMPVGSNVTGSNGALAITLPAGYYDGSKTATAADTNLLAGNIKSGTRIFGVTGTATLATGSATAAQVLNGATFSNSSGNNLTGTMPMGNNVTGSNGALSFTLPLGFYDGNKTATAADTNLVAGNIKSGATIFGVTGTAAQATGSATAAQVLSGATFSNSSANGLTGTMTDQGAPTIAPGTTSQSLAPGYYSGGTVQGDSSLVAGNIATGATIFGVSGTAPTVPENFQPIYAPHLCKPGRTGTNCTSTCASGLTGYRCDILTEPYTGATFPTYASTPWRCVLDTTTGLMWEVKKNGDASVLQGNGETFTWFDEDSTRNLGVAGTANGGSCGSSGECDTEHYVQNINNLYLCGFGDWRLPKLEELTQLLRNNYPGNTAYFPNLPAGPFWSATTYANSSLVLGMNRDGSLASGDKSTPRPVFLVRGGLTGNL